jgi:DNA-binding IclR family transcriptional regulator
MIFPVRGKSLLRDEPNHHICDGRDELIEVTTMPLHRPVKSALRCIEVLEFFAEAGRPATVGEIAERLKIPQSSTSVLLGSLVTLGYLRQDPNTRRFQATLRVMLLGSLTQGDVAVLGSLVSGMEDLRHRTRGSVILAMRQSIHVRYIVVLRGDNSTAKSFFMGAVRPVFQVAPGMILLAQETNAVIGRLLRQANAEASYSERQLALTDVLRDVEQIRQQGWAHSPGGATPGTGLTSIVMPPLAGQPLLSLTLGVPMDEAFDRRTEIVSDLRNLAGTA